MQLPYIGLMAKTPKNRIDNEGFEEAPQAPLSGEPLSGDISAWADEIAQEAQGDNAQKGANEKPKKSASKSRKKSSGYSEKHVNKGAIIGASSDPKERAASGLNPIAGLDVSLEEAERLLGKRGKAMDKYAEPGQIFNEGVKANPDGAGAFESGVTATVASLSKLIEGGDPNLVNDWVPHRPARPVKTEGGIELKMVTEFKPSGDQPTAIQDLVSGINDEDQTQVLLGVTGSGKTFTMAKVIEATQRPAIILAPNKTLAAQLYGEMKSFFPENAVEYFVSYYDYYQPEGLCPAFRYLHRKRKFRERANRPNAPFRYPRTIRAGRRGDRRFGFLHLRYRFGRNLYCDDL